MSTGRIVVPNEPGRIVVPKYGPTQVQLELARREFGYFVCDAWKYVDSAELDFNWHMEAIAEHLTWITLGQIRFLMINIPPRMAKSTLCSVMWPAWEWIDHPGTQFLTGSYSRQLSMRDALKARRLIQSPWYQSNWGDRFRLMSDETLKSQYSNDKHGRRVITSTDSTATGEGGNRVALDDPHNAIETESDSMRVQVHTFWDDTLGSRMNDQTRDSWLVIGQRTHEDDLFGHIMEREDMREIVHLILPNAFDPTRRCRTKNPVTKKVWMDPRTKKGELLSPKRMDQKATDRQKRKMTAHKFKLQYDQDPKAGGGQIIKREFWKEWPSNEAPECIEIIQSWDTALADTQEADYSARSDWGLFYHDFPAGRKLCMLLFGGWRGQVPYWKLRRIAKDSYNSVEPDTCLVEKKVSGISLIQDFRRLGMRVTPVRLDHGGRVKIDIRERAELASPVFEEGQVFFMNDSKRKEPVAETIIDECAKVPGGRNDDWATTVFQVAMWLRRKGDLKSWEDVDDLGEVRLYKRRRQSIYG